MAYYSNDKLTEFGFKSIGTNVKISDKAAIYDPDKIEIGDHSRIDDFCVISGRVVIGSYCHITPMCLVAGGSSGIFLSSFCTLAYGVKVFAQTDDYSGETLTNSLIPPKYKNEKKEPVHIERHVILGAGATVMPGVTVAEGCSVGAMSLIHRSTIPWGIYVGVPARRIKERNTNLLRLEKKFLDESK